MYRIAKPTAFLFALLALCIFAKPTVASAATAIYRSVSPSATAALATGSGNAVTISGSTATFSSALPTNVGVGDAFQYDSDNNGTVDAVAFIHGRTSSTVYTLKNAAGGTPTAATADTDWSLFRAYTALNNAFRGVENGSIAAAVQNFDVFTGTSNYSGRDAATYNEQWNFAVYGNGANYDGQAQSFGWTTGPTTYVRIYTATSTSEVGVSQRAAGKFDSTKYMFRGGNYGIALPVNYLRVDGLQLDNIQATASTSSAGEWWISNNIFDPVALGSGATTYIGLYAYNGNFGIPPSVGTYRIWNNVFAGYTFAVWPQFFTAASQVYNNTFYNNTANFAFIDSNTTLKNNLFSSTTKFTEYGGSPNVASNYNSTASSTLGYTANTNDRVSQIVTFNDLPTYDYNLSVSDTSAQDRGVDLSADSALAFSADQAGNPRPGNSVWDIGALEYQVVPDTTPPSRSGALPTGRIATTTTSTILSINTNENATCKWSTTAGTAYGSMPNTFSNTGGTTSTTTISGLSSGRLYNYYIRCQDGLSNANTTDTVVTFLVNQVRDLYAATCSFQSVYDIFYNYAYPGDTVNIPAGTCVDLSSVAPLYITIPGLTFKGAGVGQTIWQIASTTGTYTNSVINLWANDLTFKDMTIQTDTVGNVGTVFNTTGTGFHITNIDYTNRTSNGDGYFVFFTAGSDGLIDYNNLTSSRGDHELIVGRGPTSAWTYAATTGKSSAIYVEKNTFNGAAYLTDCNSNAKCVVRYNTVTGTQKIDGHGLCTNSSPARGVRQMEVYGNSWTNVTGGWAAIELRGGTGFVFNNTAAGTPLLMLSDYGYLAFCPNFGISMTPNEYPFNDQIGVGPDPKVAGSEPMYVWSNAQGGSAWPRAGGYPVDSNSIARYRTLTGSTTITFNQTDIVQANRDFFADANFDTSTSTAGLTTGILSARPSTCKTGVGYWATDQGGNWNVTDATTTNDGRLYRCASTDTWAVAYTPYAYPHYLTAASTTGSTLIDRGAGARMFPNGKFYPVSTSTASGTYADMSVTFGTTSPDYWLDVAISTWNMSGPRRKTWTESSQTLGATSTVHVVGDLNPAETYNVKVNGVVGSGITGAACTSGVCTADGSGKVTFTYSGGYATAPVLDVESTSVASSPSITTVAASSITATTATLNGDLTAINGSNATTRGFAYGTSATLATTIATTTESGSFGVATYTAATTSLTCNTTYYVRAYATNTTGTGYGSIVSFLTSPCAQTVTTSAASSVATSTATLNGGISDTGGANATQSGFAYGTVANLSTVIATSTLGSQTGTASFTSPLTGLTPSTTYYFRTYTTNSAGTAFGTILSYTTSAISVPTMSVQAASSITATTATANGTIVSIGAATVTTRGFVYGLTTAYGATTTESGTFGTGAYTASLSGLTCNTTYNISSYGTNGAGTGYSSNTTLTTSPCSPTLTTSSASSLTQTTATLNGSITATGGANATQSGFAYGTSSSLTTNTSTSTLGAQTGTASFSDGISGLTCNTTYYSRAYATNSAGTAYGSILSFLTSACAGTVTTQSASSLTLSSATLNGNITATGGANATVRGFTYGLTTAYGATTTESGSFGTGAYTSDITSLACNTLYNYRSYSTNTAGTSYGTNTTFTTSACTVPSLTSVAASSLAKTTATLNATLNATGGTNTQSGFTYSTTSALILTIGTSTLAGYTAPGSFSESISNLTCDTTYYFRPYSTNTTGASYGSVLSFTTSSCTDPVVVTQTSSSGSSARRVASNIAARAASLFTGVSTVSTPVSAPTLSTFIEALIKAGVVSADKIEAARAITTTAPSGISSTSFKRDLQLRDKGDDVKTLQTLLISKGFLPAGNTTGTFGPLTLKALQKYQSSIGVTPTGYFGPRTRAGVR
jgi:hypothetical protein